MAIGCAPWCAIHNALPRYSTRRWSWSSATSPPRCPRPAGRRLRRGDPLCRGGARARLRRFRTGKRRRRGAGARSTARAARNQTAGAVLAGGARTRPSPYAASKRAGEQILLAQGDGVAWTILRPPAVYGPGDRELLPLFRLMARGLAPVPGRLSDRVSLLYVEDLIAAVAAWVRAAAPPMGIFTSATPARRATAGRRSSPSPARCAAGRCARCRCRGWRSMSRRG